MIDPVGWRRRRPRPQVARWARRIGVAVAAATLVGAAAAPAGARDPDAPPLPAAGAATAGPTTPAVTIEGRGFGHGDGLSQVGAYGYAVRLGWDWRAILAHYYGSTTLGTVDPGTDPIAVRLTAFDDAGVVAVVRAAGGIVTSAAPAAPPATAVVAVAVGPPSAATYRVFSRGDTASCPDPAPTLASLTAPGSGWTELTTPAGFSSGTAPGLPPTRLDLAVPGLDPVTAAPADLLVACQPDGTERALRGTLRVVDGTDGEARLVDLVPLESLVRGVVPRESPASWADAGGGAGANALRAQAVAARTYAAAERRYSYATTCDTQSCQVYGGAALRTDLGGGRFSYTALEDPRSDAAVAATAGVVLRTAAGGYAYAQFSASSGGWTSGANFPAVPDEGDQYSPFPSYHTWTTTVATADIEAAWPAVGRYLGIDVVRRNGLGDWGGRVEQLVVRGTAGSVTLSGEAFRSRLGLRSTWFRVGGCGAEAPAGGAPSPAAGYHALPTAVRLLDTRTGQGGTTGPVPEQCEVGIQVTGQGGIPATGVTAVLLNVTAVSPRADGYVTAYPCATGRPGTSNLNPPRGGTVAGSVIVTPDAAGRVCLFTWAAGDLVVDAQGWFGPGEAGFAADGPRRLVDTRDGPGPVPADGVLTVPVGPGGAAVLNVTSTGSARAGFVTAYACDQPRPWASNLNLVPGRDVPNQVVSAVSADGTVCLYASAPTHLVVDLLGRYGGNDALRALPARRLLDTRTTGARLAAGDRVAVAVAGPGAPVPAGAHAAVVVVTGTGADLAGYLTAYPCDRPRPLASNVNYTAGGDAGNLATVPLAADGTLCVSSLRAVDVVVDLVGWYA
jgi:SpoIID/LytB domain protein